MNSCGEQLISNSLFLSFLGHKNCEYCEKTFEGPSAVRNLKTHIKKHLKPKAYLICEFCKKEFLYRSKKLAHQKTCSAKQLAEKLGLQIHAENVDKEKNCQEKKIFECQKCDATFIGKLGLSKHVVTVHEGKKLTSCSICSATFLNEKRLKIHLTIVHGEKKFKCPLCDHLFATKEKLKNHRFRNCMQRQK